MESRRREIAIFALLCWVAVATSQVPAVPRVLDGAATITAIRAVVDRSAAEFFKAAPLSVGLSVGVLKDGKSYTFNCGSTKKDGGVKPDADSLYPIASITKTFTGTLLAQAALEKKLSLDDDVRKYLDGDYPNLEYQGHPIRVGQLVSHVSGLPFNLPDIPEDRPPFPPVTHEVQERLDRYSRRDFLADLHSVKLERIPGEKFSYSNAAAVLASIILERIYGEPYEELVKQKIAAPLHMTDTTISLNASQRKRLVTGYDEKGLPAPYPTEMMLGAGALKSTVADMLKYAQWEMAEADEAVKLSHQPTWSSGNYSAGLNWQMIKAPDYRRVWQEGSLPGFSSMCVTFPGLDIAVVAFANENDPTSSHALTVMADAIATGLDPRAQPL